MKQTLTERVEDLEIRGANALRRMSRDMDVLLREYSWLKERVIKLEGMALPKIRYASTPRKPWWKRLLG